MWIAITAAAIILLVLIIAYICYRIAFSRWGKVPDQSKSDQYDPYMPRIDELREKLKAMPCESVHIRSHDGLRLAARYYEITPGAPVALMFHGYRSHGFTDFCVGASLCKRRGINFLLIEQRGIARSGGNTISFGINERKDCLAWTRYVAERFGEDTKMVLCGVSMGAATVLMASELELPRGVVGITADSGYTSPGAIIREVIRGMHLPVWPAYAFVWLGALIFGRFNLSGSSALKAVKNSRLPIQIFHGDEDRFVPCSMAYELYEAANCDKELTVAPGAGHVLSYFLIEEEYERKYYAFFDRIGC
ncbi:MAG: alpha/beta hydrolase [Oscillospiraceae bacterium]|nr:alpha/beta hydrolase [Oscillospiraceae bacterium]